MFLCKIIGNFFNANGDGLSWDIINKNTEIIRNGCTFFQMETISLIESYKLLETNQNDLIMLHQIIQVLHSRTKDPEAQHFIKNDIYPKKKHKNKHLHKKFKLNEHEEIFESNILLNI